jgi:hypothetical protein
MPELPENVKMAKSRRRRHLLISYDRSAVTMWAASSHAVSDAKDLIQRQIIQARMQQSHALLHAAAVCVGEIAFPIVGPKGSGKTSVQLQLARRGFSLLTADRLFVGLSGPDTLIARGYPARASLTLETFKRFPELGESGLLVRDGPTKALMLLSDIAARLRTGVGREGRLGALVALTDEHSRKVCVSKPSRSRQLEQMLDPNWLDGADPLVRNWLGLFPFDRQRARDLHFKVCDIASTLDLITIDAVTGQGPSADRLADQLREVADAKSR